MKKSSKKVKLKAAGASNVHDSELTLGKVKKLKPIALAKLLAGLTDTERQINEGIDLKSMAAAAQSNVPGSPPEPVYEDTEQEDIQGNIIPGFNKSYQHFLFFGCGKRHHTKIFIRWLVPFLRLSSMLKVMRFRKEYRERRLKLGKANTFMAETWVNIAFSYHGIAKLTKKSDR